MSIFFKRPKKFLQIQKGYFVDITVTITILRDDEEFNIILKSLGVLSYPYYPVTLTVHMWFCVIESPLLSMLPLQYSMWFRLLCPCSSQI